MTKSDKIIEDLKEMSSKYMTILQSNVIPKSVLDMYIEHLETSVLADEPRVETCEGVKPASIGSITFVDCAPGYKWMAINLEEVERLVKFRAIMIREPYHTDEMFEAVVADLRQRIGYTLTDLPSPPKPNDDGK